VCDIRSWPGGFQLTEKGSGSGGDWDLYKTEFKFASDDEAKEIGEKAGVDFTKIDLKEFQMGLSVEQEHNDLTNGDPGMIAKIAAAHLEEIPNYYTLLAKMENEAKETVDLIDLRDPKVANAIFTKSGKTKDSPDPAYMAKRKELEDQLKIAKEAGDTDKTKAIQDEINDLIKKGTV